MSEGGSDTRNEISVNDNHTFKWEEDVITEISGGDVDLNYTALVQQTPQLASDYLHQSKVVFAVVLTASSVISNVAIFLVTISRICRETRTNSIHHLLCHLAVADILVTAIFLPAQAGWIRTDRWKYGDADCKVFAFFHVFGRYLASFLVVCVSIDRYLEATNLIHGLDTRKRAGVMIALAWAGSLLVSATEASLRGVRSYASGRTSCSRAGSLLSWKAWVVYDVIQTFLLCGLPITVATVCYTSVFWKLFRSQNTTGNGERRQVLVCIKKRTIKLSIATAVVFIICWAPSIVLKLGSWIDVGSVFMIDPGVWKLLLLFPCTSTFFHPVIYYHFYLKRRH